MVNVALSCIKLCACIISINSPVWLTLGELYAEREIPCPELSVGGETRTSLSCSLFMYRHDGAFLKLIVALYPITAVTAYAHVLFIITPSLPDLATYSLCHHGHSNLRIQHHSSFYKATGKI